MLPVWDFTFKIKMQFYWVKPIWTNFAMGSSSETSCFGGSFNPSSNPNHAGRRQFRRCFLRQRKYCCIWFWVPDTGGSISPACKFLRRCWLKANLRNRFPLRTDCICFPALTKLALLLPLLKMQLWYLTPLHSMTLWIPLLKEKRICFSFFNQRN